MRARLQHDRTVFKHTQPDLGPLVSSNGTDGEAEFLPQAVHNPELFQMFLMGAMGEIEPGHIHTRFHHTPESCLIGTDGPSVQIIFVLRIKPFTTPFSTPLLQFCFHCIAAAWKLQRKMRLGSKTRSPFIECRSLPILLHLFRSLFGPRGFLTPSPLTNAPRLYYAYCISYISTLSTDAGSSPSIIIGEANSALSLQAR